MIAFRNTIVLIIVSCDVLNAQGISLYHQKEGVSLPYQEQRGACVLHLGNQMFGRMPAVTMPVLLHAEATIFPYITAGPLAGYFRFINSVAVSKSVTKYEQVDVKYHHFFGGLRINYHAAHILENLLHKEIINEYFDLYVGTWIGYSFSYSEHPLALEQVITSTRRLRGGIAAGVRSMIVPRFGLFLELGYSSYGIGAFGCSIRLDNPKKQRMALTQKQQRHSMYFSVAEFNQ